MTATQGTTTEVVGTMQTPAAFRRGSLSKQQPHRRNSLRDLMEGHSKEKRCTDKLLVGKLGEGHEDSSRTVSTRTVTSTSTSHSVSSSGSSVMSGTSACSSVGSISIRSQHSTSYKPQQHISSSQQEQDDHPDVIRMKPMSTTSANRKGPIRGILMHSQQQQQRKQARQERNVSFPAEIASVVGYVTCLAEITSEERWETWWCPQEYQAIRLAAKYSTKQIRKCDKSSADSVDRAFKSALHLANLLPEDEETEVSSDDDELSRKNNNKSPLRKGTKNGAAVDLYQAALQDPASCAPQHVTTLEQWCTSKLPTRGLEKYVGAAHKAERQQYLADAKKVVVELNAKPKEERCSTEIALTYQEYCRYAVLFARLTAHGDECAAKKAQAAMSANSSSVLKDGGPRRTGRRRNSINSTDGGSSGDECSVDSRMSADSTDSNRLTHLQRSFSKRKLLGEQVKINKSDHEEGAAAPSRGTFQRSSSRRALMMQQQQQDHDSKRNLYKQDSKRSLVRGVARRHSNEGPSSGDAAVLFAAPGRRASMGGTVTGNGGLTRQKSARGLMTRQRSSRGLRRHHSSDEMTELRQQQQQQQDAGFLVMTPNNGSPQDGTARGRRDSIGVGAERRDSLDLTCGTMRSTRRGKRPQRAPAAAGEDTNNEAAAQDPLLSAAP